MTILYSELEALNLIDPGIRIIAEFRAGPETERLPIREILVRGPVNSRTQDADVDRWPLISPRISPLLYTQRSAVKVPQTKVSASTRKTAGSLNDDERDGRLSIRARNANE